MDLQFIKPAPVLAPYIERYWMLDHDTGSETCMPQVLPGVGMDLYLHYKDPFVTAHKGKLPSSHIIYSGENSCTLLPMKSIGFIAIRFRAAMFKHFTDLSFNALADSFPDVESIWGKKGKAMQEGIDPTRNRHDLIRHLEAFLIERLDKHRRKNWPWSPVIKTLYYNHSAVKLPELAQELNISYRHFRRKFIEETGFSPKHFQRLARFRSAVKPLLLHKEKNYLPVALGEGYFDQTHFIKEFRYFTGYTPAAFLQEKNFMSHFYYPSW